MVKNGAEWQQWTSAHELCLAGEASPDAVAALARVVQRNDHATLRMNALRTLIQIGPAGRGAADAVRPLTESAEPRLRRAATLALTRFEGKP